MGEGTGSIKDMEHGLFFWREEEGFKRGGTGGFGIFEQARRENVIGMRVTHDELEEGMVVGIEHLGGRGILLW
jgi:hypothetical protein